MQEQHWLATSTLCAALLALAAAVPVASATHVTPTFIEGPKNFTCSDFAADGQTLNELKVDPAADGTYADGNITVTLDVDGNTKVFSFVANASLIELVFVKAGSAGHHLYAYDPSEDADTGLTSPGAGTSNQISHISFCYTTCELTPDMPECVPTCEEQPDLPECPPTCEEQPDMPECPPDCEDQPDHPDCPQQECPPGTTVSAVANNGGSITVAITSNDDGELQRRAGDGDFVKMLDFSGNTVHEDTNTTIGVTYTYRVVVSGDVCDQVEVTAIPVFPAALAGVAALGLAAAGYVVLRRRK